MLGTSTKTALILSLLIPASLASCSSDDDTPAPVTSDDAGASGDATDAAITSETSADGDADAATTCDLGTSPTMPALTSEFVIELPDGGGLPPAPTGGDEAGLWVYTKITAYLGAAATGQVDPAASKVEGQGFIELGGGKFRQFVNTTTTLSTAAVGQLVRAGSSEVLGTYTTQGVTVQTTITCRESTGETSGLGEIGFSRIDGTRARLHITSQSQLGTTKLVIELEKRP